MSKNVLFQITNELPEIIFLKQEYKKAKSQLVRVQRKIISTSKKFKFLSDIVGRNGFGATLELGCLKLFKEIGFEDVKKLKQRNPAREDLQIWCPDCLIVIECKGSKNMEPPDAELNQIKRYIDYRENTIKARYPLKELL